MSVIVPVYNDERRIGKCIEALLAQTYRSDRYEIIAVDNGSTDGSLSVIKGYRIKLLHRFEKQSSYAARNKGIRNARGEIIGFTDSDCIPAPDWIEKGTANLLKNPDCGLVGGRIELFFKNPERPTAVELYESITNFRQKEDIELRNFGSTANVFARRDVFEKVGLFNDSLKSGGDNEWGRRVHSQGFALLYAEDTVVAHPARNSLGQMYKRITRLVGGNYDQRESTRRIMLYWLRGTRNSMALIARALIGMHPAERLGRIERIKFIYACTCADAIRNYERLRLLLGGKTRNW